MAFQIPWEFPCGDAILYLWLHVDPCHVCHPTSLVHLAYMRPIPLWLTDVSCYFTFIHRPLGAHSLQHSWKLPSHLVFPHGKQIYSTTSSNSHGSQQHAF
jgi:hypothetical protein